MVKNPLMMITLVPIRVGMILLYKDNNVLVNTCPHTRGDDPIASPLFNYSTFLSPYAWG